MNLIKSPLLLLFVFFTSILYINCSDRKVTIETSFTSSPNMGFDPTFSSSSKSSDIKAGAFTILRDSIYYADGDGDMVSISVNSLDSDLKLYTSEDSAASVSVLQYPIVANRSNGFVLLSMDISNLQRSGSVRIVGRDDVGNIAILTRTVSVVPNVRPVANLSYSAVETLSTSIRYRFDLSLSTDPDEDIGGGIVGYGYEINNASLVEKDFAVFDLIIKKGFSTRLRFYVEDKEGERGFSEEIDLNPPL